MRVPTSPPPSRTQTALTFVVRIKDSIHGALPLTAEELAIADHPYHQRSNGIRQNGLCYQHAPSAVHTRRAHMLGTVASANRLIDALFEGSEKDQRKFETWRRRHATPGTGVRLHEMPRRYQVWLRRITRLAALVHDVGHGPLSHDFEIFLPSFQDCQELLRDPRLQALCPLIDLWYKLHPRETRLTHEVISCILFTLMWNDTHPNRVSVGDASIPAVISTILLGLACEPGAHKVLSVLDSVQRELLPLATDMISSAPVDADRVDYLLRDTQAMGVELGRFDLDRVLKSAITVQVNGSLRLGWRLSGLTAIEQFLIARYFMFTEMYGHKTNHSGSMMLRTVRNAHRDGRMPSPLVTVSLDEFVASFARLSDELFLRLLAGEFPSQLNPSADIQEIGRRLQRRALWKCIFHDRDTQRPPAHQQSRLDALVKHLRAKYPNIPFYESTRPVRATKDLDKGACLARLVQRRGGRRYFVDQCRSWLECSDLINLLHRREMALVRIFADVPTGMSSSKIKGEALSFLAKYDAKPHN